MPGQMAQQMKSCFWIWKWRSVRLGSPLEAAGMGVAFRAKPAVRDAAGFRIEHADLRGLLYLQGFSASEFAAPRT